MLFLPWTQGFVFLPWEALAPQDLLPAGARSSPNCRGRHSIVCDAIGSPESPTAGLRLLFVLETKERAWGRVPGPSPWGLAGKGHSQDSFPPEGLRQQTGCQGLTSHSPLACRSRARGEMGTASTGPCPRPPASADSRGHGRVQAGEAERLGGLVSAV